MTCDAVRDALLITDLPLAATDDSELALHLRECAQCAMLVHVLTRDLGFLGTSLRRRTVKRRRIAAAVATVAAAAIVVLVARKPEPVTPPVDAARTQAAVNVHRDNVVSVQVAPGKRATVFNTSDPTVTVVWLTDGGGL